MCLLFVMRSAIVISSLDLVWKRRAVLGLRSGRGLLLVGAFSGRCGGVRLLLMGRSVAGGEGGGRGEGWLCRRGRVRRL